MFKAEAAVKLLETAPACAAALVIASSETSSWFS